MRRPREDLPLDDAGYPPGRNVSPALSPDASTAFPEFVPGSRSLGFGVTLYEMLTGQVPFSAQDPLELIHCHLAKIPPSPAELNPRIPLGVSAIVMKLLAKTAEDRYRSAFGLKADLEECRIRFAQQGSIEPFPLGQKDVSDRRSASGCAIGRRSRITSHPVVRPSLAR
jgi:serine/threonine protein kinase